jgi:heterodisulfide reductase subunit A
MAEKRVLVIGSGVAGLSAALDLAAAGITVDVVEQYEYAGGQGIRLSCKATKACVKCGACMADDRLGKVLRHPRIRLMTGSSVEAPDRNGRFAFQIRHKPEFIDPSKCNSCGICLKECPAEGAIIQGTSGHHRPFYAISEKTCLYLKDKSCTACRDTCPTRAINLDAVRQTESIQADAVILAAGFSTHRPYEKPYGYGVFPDVVTNQELETILKRHGKVLRPSDYSEPARMAFIQCVGSRDAKLGHLWCSTYCCGSALRLARLIGHRQPQIQTTLFYIDIQTFGRTFETYYTETKKKLRMIRSIPGDIYPSENKGLKITYLDPLTADTLQEDFDLIVLSVAMIPPAGLADLLKMFHLDRIADGFLSPGEDMEREGIFAAGAVTGPMPLAEAAAGGSKAAWQAICYLKTA